MIKRIFVPLAGYLLMACAGAQTAPDDTAKMAAANPCAGNPCAANPCAGNPCAAAPAADGGSFADWNSWTEISTSPFVSKGHRKAMARLYVENPEHAAWYRRLPAGESAPVGFRVLKVMYKDASATSIANVMGMTKMPAGYDPDNGDWFYGVYDETGTKAMQTGKIEMCINCHSASDDTDYLSGLPK